MARDARSLLGRIGKAVELSGVLGLSLGYVVFYGVFPSSTVPTSGDASLLWILFVLSVTSVLVGFAADDVPLAMISSFGSVPIALVVSTAMGLSPGLTGLYVVSPDEVPFFLAHYGLVLYVVGFLVNIVGTFTGHALRDPYLRKLYERGRYGIGGRK